jgi:hypothetical protein
MLTTAPFIDFEEPEQLDQEPEPPERTDEERQAWYNEAIESWREYKRTGRHITLEELEAWVDQLETDPNAPPPECHT